VTGDGFLNANSGGFIIVPAGFDASNMVRGTPVFIQSDSNVDIDLSGTVVAVNHRVTINGTATSKDSIKASELTNKTLFVVTGGVTVSEDIGGVANINVLDETATVTVDTKDQTAAVNWDIKGTLTAKKLPTKNAGTIKVGGDATFEEAVTGITGTINIGKNAVFKNTLATGGYLNVGGDLKVTGAATLGGNLKVDGAATFDSTLTITETSDFTATFNGVTEIKGKLTSNGSSSGFKIAGTGAVTLTAAPDITTKALGIASTGGVYFTSITTGTGTGTVALAKAVLKAGNATAPIALAATGTGFALGTGDVLSMENNGTIVAGSTGKLELPNTVFGEGTYTAAGDVTITAKTAGDEITTAAEAGKGLILGSAATALSLLTQGGEATYTAVKDDTGVVTFSAGDITVGVVGSLTTDKAASLKASATANIKLGTEGNAAKAIKLGNTATLVLDEGAKIGVFTGTGKDVAAVIPAGTAGTVGTAKISAAKLVNSNPVGTFTATDDAASAAVTLTGATDGNSSIFAGADITAGS
jgi:hypothetical protein